MFSRGRVPLVGCRSILEGPQFSPRETTRLFRFSPCGSIQLTRTGRPGDAPLRRVFNLSHESCTHNEKTAESQASKRVFRQVLHKWHSPNGVAKRTKACSPANTKLSLKSIYYQNQIKPREAWPGVRLSTVPRGHAPFRWANPQPCRNLVLRPVRVRRFDGGKSLDSALPEHGRIDRPVHIRVAVGCGWRTLEACST